MARIAFVNARRIVREGMEQLVDDLVRARDAGDGTYIEWPEEGFRRLFGTSEDNLVIDISLKRTPDAE